MASQLSLHHVSNRSFTGNTHALCAHPKPRTAARQPVKVQAAVQTDAVVAVTTLLTSAVFGYTAGGIMGSISGAIEGLQTPGKPVARKAVDGYSEAGRAGACMGGAKGMLVNLGVQGMTSTVGGIALGILVYAALTGAAQKSSK